jgi:hypothetical protein
MRSTVSGTGGGGSLETSLTINKSQGYLVKVGAGGNADTGAGATNGIDSTFSTIISLGGGRGGNNAAGILPLSGGSGGGGSGHTVLAGQTGGAGTNVATGAATNQGFKGADSVTNNGIGRGGGGAGSAGSSQSGGTGVASVIIGSSVTYAVGGNTNTTNSNGDVNTGNGASTLFENVSKNGTAGGSGIIVISYLNSLPDLVSIHSSHVCNGQAAGGTTPPAPSTARSGYKTYTFTAGDGNISW